VPIGIPSRSDTSRWLSRRGSDVVKALALGADVVLLGREGVRDLDADTVTYNASR
jgi:hypothetical protein